MRMLVADSTDHRRRERTIGKRPVGNGERGLVGSDQSAGDKEEDGPAHHKNRKSMDRRMVSGRHWPKSQRRIIHDWWMRAIDKMASNPSKKRTDRNVGNNLNSAEAAQTRVAAAGTLRTGGIGAVAVSSPTARSTRSFNAAMK